jgi:hypothetical protein
VTHDPAKSIESAARVVHHAFMRKLVFIVSAIAISMAGAATPTHADINAGPQIAGCPLFPADNIWNARVDTLPLHPRSAAYINSIGANTTLHPDFGTFWQGAPIGIPFAVAPATQPIVTVTIGPDGYPDQSDPGPMPIPPDAPVEGGNNSDGDRHVLVVKQGECKLYELYRAFKINDSQWQADSTAIYDLNSNALRPAGWTSADAAGLSILAGLICIDEVKAGEIAHAIRFTASRTQRALVWPARHFASSITDLNVPAMGQRFRLKASRDLSAYPKDIQVIFTAFKRFGIILADNGSNWYIGGAHDPAWNDDMLVSAFRTLKGSDFEAVDASSLMLNRDSGQVRSSVAFTPTNWLNAPSIQR